MKAAVALLLLVAMVAPAGLSGCLCEPLLEVRHCRDEQRGCIPGPAALREWTADDAARFPDIQALLETVPAGTHGHVDYTEDEEAAFWDHWGLDNSDHDQQLFVRHDGNVFRLRVYTCDGVAF